MAGSEIDGSVAHVTNVVDIDCIDRILVEAEIRLKELHHLNLILNEKPDEKENITKRVSIVFREMILDLYSVLDQLYYFVYCTCRHKGKHKYMNYAGEVAYVKMPNTQWLQWSTSEGCESRCSQKRDKWLNEKYRQVFGDTYSSNKEWFKRNILYLQAVAEVDANGSDKKDSNGELSLVNYIPREDKFVPMVSTDNIDQWSRATEFRLLHFYRNVTIHKTLIECASGTGYLNKDTSEFKPVQNEEDIEEEKWVMVEEAHFIQVPEIKHLIEKKRTYPPKFHLKPLLRVCPMLFDLVKDQRHGMIQKLDRQDLGEYPYTVRFWDKQGVVVTKGKDIFKRTWPSEQYPCKGASPYILRKRRRCNSYH